MGIDAGWEISLVVGRRIGDACQVARQAADFETGTRRPDGAQEPARAAWTAFLELCTPSFALGVFTAHAEIVARYLAARETQRLVQAKQAAGQPLSWQEALESSAAEREADALRAIVEALARVHQVDLAAVAEHGWQGDDPADANPPPPAHRG